MVVKLRTKGVSLRQIADGHTTRRGMPWNSPQVKRVLERAVPDRTIYRCFTAYSGSTLRGLIQVCLRLGLVPFGLPGATPIVVGPGILRVESDGFGEVGDRLIMLAFTAQEMPRLSNVGTFIGSSRMASVKSAIALSCSPFSANEYPRFPYALALLGRAG